MSGYDTDRYLQAVEEDFMAYEAEQMVEPPEFDESRFRVKEYRLITARGDHLTTGDTYKEVAEYAIPGDVIEEWQKISSGVVQDGDYV